LSGKEKFYCKKNKLKTVSKQTKPIKVAKVGKSGTYTEGFKVGETVMVNLDDNSKQKKGVIISFDPEDDVAGYISIGGVEYKTNFSWVEKIKK
jgi:predicted transcriptional regulator